MLLYYSIRNLPLLCTSCDITYYYYYYLKVAASLLLTTLKCWQDNGRPVTVVHYYTVPHVTIWGPSLFLVAVQPTTPQKECVCVCVCGNVVV